MVGKLRRPHGLRGEMLMEIITDFPDRLQAGSLVYVGEALQPLHLVKTRLQGTALLVTLEGYTSLEAAGALRNQNVYVTAIDRPALPKGEYYLHQLLGMDVIAQAGQTLGRVEEILETGANDVLVVRRPHGSDILIPFLESLLLRVDLEHSAIHLRLPPGLLPEEEE